MTQDYELVVKGVRNFENKVTVTVALQDKERFDGEIFDLDVAMDRVEGAALEFYEAAARRSVRQVFLEVAEKLSEKVESYLQHQYSFKIENPANKHERPGNDSNLLIVFYVQIMPDDFVMQLHRF